MSVYSLCRGSLYKGLINKLKIPSFSIKRTQQFCNKSNSELVFQHSKIGSFYQDAPTLGNQFLEDSFLKSTLRRILPQKVFNEITDDLERFGQRVADDIFELGFNAELNQPFLKHNDAWGRRVDDVVTSREWKRLKEISSEEGLIAIGYENKHNEWSRIYQMAKMYLFCPSSGLFSCPLAMTDGAAKVFKVGDHEDKLLQNAYQNLTSRNPKSFWTSGQWMTERKGGSDVAYGTETVAKPQEDGSYKLYGFKWFTSATDADMTLTLARILDTNNDTVPGSKGLSLFFLQTRQSDGKLNGIEIQNLKNKLGTKQLPTAELLLDGATAYKLSEEGKGVSSISNMLTMSRIHNSVASAGAMRRILAFARDYSTKRFVSHKYLSDHPLHMQTLARMEVETRAALSLVLEVSRLLGLQETCRASETDDLTLRLLTPLAKIYTAKQAVSVSSEGLECLGGQGYIEDTGYPGILRDAQVLPIWEGTTNVLSLDVLRAIKKSEGKVILAFRESIVAKLSTARGVEKLNELCDVVQRELENTLEFLKYAAGEKQGYLETAARDFAYSLTRLYTASLLIEHAAWSEAGECDVAVASRWCSQDLSPVFRGHNKKAYTSEESSMDYVITMKGHSHFKEN